SGTCFFGHRPECHSSEHRGAGTSAAARTNGRAGRSCTGAAATGCTTSGDLAADPPAAVGSGAGVQPPAAADSAATVAADPAAATGTAVPAPVPAVPVAAVAAKRAATAGSHVPARYLRFGPRRPGTRQQG